MNRKTKLDSLEREHLLQEMASFDISPDRRRLVDEARADAPDSWDEAVESYRSLEKQLSTLKTGPEPRLRKSPLDTAFQFVDARERRRAKLRRDFQDRLVVTGVGPVAARAAQAVANGLMGLTVTVRGASQIASTVREGINHALLDGMLAQFPDVAKIYRARVVETSATTPEEEPA